MLSSLDNEILADLTEEGVIEQEIDTSSDLRNLMQETIFAADEKLDQIFQERNPVNNLHRTHGYVDTSNLSAKVVTAKLPKLKIKNFNGNPLEFQSFWDSFDAMVNSADLEAVTKFMYLKSYLRGPALSSIHLPEIIIRKLLKL